MQARLENLQKQRDQTVAKLKEATKYDTTLQLLEKYGGGAAKPKPASGTVRKTPKGNPGPKQERRTTGFAPPPTANIPLWRPPSSVPGTPDRSAPVSPLPNPPHTAGPHTSNWQPPMASMDPSAEFAPNAFNPPPQYMTESRDSSWYDRLMDVLLGEDETHPKNRLVLICQNCRLVNGQAPPGVRTLPEVGRWRCSGCGTMNGKDPVIDALVPPTATSRVSRDNPTIDEAPEPNKATEEGDVGDDLVTGHESDVTQYSEDGQAQDVLQDEMVKIAGDRSVGKDSDIKAGPLPRRSERRKPKSEEEE